MATKFGRVLAILRRDRKLSQEEFAHRSGIHRTYVSQLERGIKMPSLAILFKLAKALDVPPSKIVKMLEPNNSNSRK